MSDDDKPASAADGDSDRPRKGMPPILTSDELLAGHREVVISHHGEYYRLRVTRHGKLILHK